MIRVGDTVVWRSGKSKSKNVQPMGIADCTVIKLGVDSDGRSVAQILLPEGFPSLIKQRQWALLADLEKD